MHLLVELSAKHLIYCSKKEVKSKLNPNPKIT